MALIVAFIKVRSPFATSISRLGKLGRIEPKSSRSVFIRKDSRRVDMGKIDWSIEEFFTRNATSMVAAEAVD